MAGTRSFEMDSLIEQAALFAAGRTPFTTCDTDFGALWSSETTLMTVLQKEPDKFFRRFRHHGTPDDPVIFNATEPMQLLLKLRFNCLYENVMLTPDNRLYKRNQPHDPDYANVHRAADAQELLEMIVTPTTRQRKHFTTSVVGDYINGRLNSDMDATFPSLSKPAVTPDWRNRGNASALDTISLIIATSPDIRQLYPKELDEYIALDSPIINPLAQLDAHTLNGDSYFDTRDKLFDKMSDPEQQARIADERENMRKSFEDEKRRMFGDQDKIDKLPGIKPGSLPGQN